MSSSDILIRLSDADAGYLEAVAKFPSILAARAHSLESLERIRVHLSKTPPPPESDIDMLAVAGSLARLEASTNSDLDLIMVTSGVCASQGGAGPAGLWRDQLCTDLGLEAPNKKGVFFAPEHRANLERIAGESGESYETVAKRALLILESRWVYNESIYISLVEKTIDCYSKDVFADSTKNFVFLLNDIIRYFRSLCVNYQHTKSEIEYGKWPIRNIKLRHSRVVMYFSMILVIGILSTVRDRDKIEALKRFIAMEPLRRIYNCYQLSGDAGFEVFGRHYAEFLEMLSQSAVRIDLEGLDYEMRYMSPHFSRLKDNSDELSIELMRFYDARRGSWDRRFFEYMIL